QGGTGQQHQQEKRERDVPEIHGEPRRARVNAHSSSLWQLPYPGPASMRRQAEEGTQLLAQAVHVTAMALPQPAAITLRQPARLAVTFAQLGGQLRRRPGAIEQLRVDLLRQINQPSVTAEFPGGDELVDLRLHLEIQRTDLPFVGGVPAQADEVADAFQHRPEVLQRLPGKAADAAA